MSSRGGKLVAASLAVLATLFAERDALAQAAGGPGGCGTEVRLDKPGGPFGKLAPPDPKHPYTRAIPVRSQGTRGICYAFGATGLVDAWRFTHEPTKYKFGKPFPLTSPYPVAVGASKNRGYTDTISGGTPWEAVNFLRTVNADKTRNFGCDNEKLFAAQKLHTLHENAYVQKLEAAWDEYHKYELDTSKLHHIGAKYKVLPREKWDAEMIRLYPRYLIDERLSGERPDLYYWDTHYTYGAVPIARTLECHLLEENFPAGSIPAHTMNGANLMLAALLRQTSKVEFLSKYFAQACKDPAYQIDMSTIPEPVTEPAGGFFAPGAGKLVEEAINHQLGLDNPQPVAISYCPAILESKARDFWNYREETVTDKDGKKTTIRLKSCTTDNKEDKDPYGSHVSLVIGRRPHPTEPGRCQFLVRNSWGSGCDKYAAAGWNDCADGDVWIDSDRLSNNTFKLTYLKR